MTGSRGQRPGRILNNPPRCDFWFLRASAKTREYKGADPRRGFRRLGVDRKPDMAPSRDHRRRRPGIRSTRDSSPSTTSRRRSLRATSEVQQAYIKGGLGRQVYPRASTCSSRGPMTRADWEDAAPRDRPRMAHAQPAKRGSGRPRTPAWIAKSPPASGPRCRSASDRP